MELGLTFETRTLAELLKNRVLREIFGLRWTRVTGEWGRVNNEQLYDLYSSHNTVQLMKSRRKKWAGNVESMRRKEMHIRFWWENLQEGDKCEDLRTDGKQH